MDVIILSETRFVTKSHYTEQSSGYSFHWNERQCVQKKSRCNICSESMRFFSVITSDSIYIQDPGTTLGRGTVYVDI